MMNDFQWVLRQLRSEYGRCQHNRDHVADAYVSEKTQRDQFFYYLGKGSGYEDAVNLLERELEIQQMRRQSFWSRLREAVFIMRGGAG